MKHERPYDPEAHAIDRAMSLKSQYGDLALAGATIGLATARQIGDACAVDHWSRVCTILGADESMMPLSIAHRGKLD